MVLCRHTAVQVQCGAETREPNRDIKFERSKGQRVSDGIITTGGSATDGLLLKTKTRSATLAKITATRLEVNFMTSSHTDRLSHLSQARLALVSTIINS